MTLGIPYKRWQVRQKNEDEVPLDETIATLVYDDLNPNNGHGPDEEDLGDSEAEWEILEEGDRS